MLYPAALQKNDSGNPDGWAHTSRMCYYIQPPLVCQPQVGPPDSFVRGACLGTIHSTILAGEARRPAKEGGGAESLQTAPPSAVGRFLPGMAVGGVGAATAAAAISTLAGPPVFDHPHKNGGHRQHQDEKYSNRTRVHTTSLLSHRHIRPRLSAEA